MTVGARGAAARAADDRERTIREFMPYIRYTARRFSWRLPPGLAEEDLVSAGVMGLLDALRKFRAGEVKLKTYAEYRIRGAMLDELRAADNLARSARERVNAMKGVHGRLEQTLGRMPEDHEIAAALGISIDDYHKTLLENGSGLTLSFGDLEPSADDDFSFIDNVPGPAAYEPLARLECENRRRVLEGVIAELPEKEKLVLSLYYWEELTMKEVANVLGLTEGRVCQLHAQAVVRCKARLERALARGTAGRVAI